MSKSSFQIGDTVAWDRGLGTAEGTISKRFTDRVTKTLKGSEVTRNPSQEEPAFLIEQEDGDKVLKSCTEIRSA